MLPILQAFDGGARTVADCLPALKKQFRVPEAEAVEMIPSGRVSVLASRAHWARTYMAKAGLLTSLARNHHQITELGRKVLAGNPARIDNGVLGGFKGFQDWTAGAPAAPGPDRALAQDTGTPEEILDRAHEEMNATLAAELLVLLQAMDPVRFEGLILDLLKAMGYGASALGSLHKTPVSGDGGIDGIIHEDALGLDAVYIQAKRYTSDATVGRPAIQQFVGSLTGEGATKGVFVTTSDFSREARDYLRKVQQRIVLINGTDLTRLMIAHGVGVKLRKSYDVKGIDENYFGSIDGE